MIDETADRSGNSVSVSSTGISSITFRFYAYGAEQAGTGSGGLSGPLTFSGTLVDTAPSITAATFNGTFGQAFSANITAANSPTSFGNSTALPPGLSLNSTTGAITGTPTQAGSFNATLSASNGNGTRSAAFTFNIAKGTPTITTLPTASAINDGQALSSSILSGGNVTGTGGASLPGNFTFTNPSLTPTTTGNQTILFTPTDTVNWETLTRNVLVTVNIVPRIFVTPTSLTGFSTKQNASSANQTLSVNATNIIGGVTVTAPAGYEISTNGTTYSSLLFLSPTTSNTTIIASDNAGNYGNTGNWTNGSNRGSGFRPWQTPGGNGTTGFNGFFVGAANATQLPNHAALYTGGNAFTIFAGGAGSAFQDATRPFSSPMLPGQTLRHSLAFSFDNGNKGFNLLSGTTEVFNFNINNGGYTWTGGNASMTPWPGVRERGVVVNFAFTRTLTGFNFTFNSTQDANLTRNGTISAVGIDTLKYYISDAGGGDGGNIYFNNLQITTPVGNLTNTTLFVRLATNGTPGVANGNLTLSSANATTQTVTLSGNVIELAPPLVTSQTINGTVGQAFLANISATNSPTSFGNSTALPAGLTLNSTTGEISGTPTAAGNFTVVATATNIDGTGTGNLTFVIGRGTPTITTPPTASRIFTDQTLANSTLTGGNATGISGADLPGNFTFTSPTTNFPEPGNQSASVTFTPTDSGNWTTTTENVTVPVAVRMPPVITSNTINGTVGANLTFSVNATRSPSSYTLNGSVPGLTFDTATGNFSGSPTTAGNYTLPVTATNSDGTGSGNLTFVISKGTPSIITAPTATPIFINQTLANSTLSGLTSVPGNFTFNTPGDSFSTSGNYTANITFTPDDGANWNSLPLSVTINVSERLRPVIPSKTINGTVGSILDEPLEFQNPITSLSANGSVPGLSFNSTTLRFSGTPTTAGNFSIVITANNDEGSGNGTIQFIIAKGNSSISVTGNSSFVYSALPQGPDTVTKSGSPGNVTYSYQGANGTTYAASANKPANVGNYTVTASLAGDSNYNSANSAPFAFAITPRPITITADNQSKTYGTTAPISGTLNTNFMLSNGTLATGESISSLTITYNGTPAGNAANATVGNYTITPSDLVIAGGGASASNYNITYVNGTLTVNRASLTITAGNQTVAYGTPAGNVTAAGNYTVSGFVNGETATVIGGNATYTTTYTATTAVSTAGVTITPVVTGLTADNYSFTAANGTITVIRATPVITTNPTASAITFSQTLANSTLTGGSANTPGNFTFTTPSTAPSFGTANQSVTFTPNDITNFNTVTTNVSVTVNKGNPTIVTPPTAPIVLVGQSLGNLTLSGNASVPGNFTFTNSTQSFATSGLYSANYTFNPSDAANWNSVVGSLAVTVVPVPQINVSPGNLTGFSTKENAASANQTLTVNGTNLLGPVTVTAPPGYEISTNGTTYSTSLSLTANQTSTSTLQLFHASDNATSSAYTSNWTNSSNGGSGFGAWNLYTSGSGSHFIESSVSKGFGNVDTGAKAFGMWGRPSGDNFANAERVFSSPLAVGQSFSIQLAAAFRNGAKGISLFSGGFDNSNQVWNFNVGADKYTANGTDLGWSYSSNSVFTLTATRTNPTNLQISLARGNQTHSANLTASLDRVRLYVGSTDADNDLNNFYFNNLQIFTSANSTTSNLTNTTLFLRLATNGTPGPANGNLTLSSQGAATALVALSGNVIALQPPVVASGTFNGSVGSNFTASINATNSPNSYTANRTIPGLTLNSTTGVFSGVPTTAGNFSVTVTAINADGNGTGSLTFAIAKGIPTIASKPAASDIFNGRSLISSQLTGGNATNGVGGTVPGNFTFTFPNKIPPAGTNSENVTFTPGDPANYETVFTDVAVTVLATSADPPVVMPATINATVGQQNFTYTINATNSPYLFRAVTPLPDGLSINSKNGTISGMPVMVTSNWTTIVSATNRLESNGNITTGTGNATITFNIAKGSPAITVLPVASPVLVDERIDTAQPSLTGGETDPPLEGVFTYTNATQTFSAPGEYWVGVTFTPVDSENWNPATATIPIQVNPRQMIGSLTIVSDLGGKPIGSDYLLEGNYSETFSESEITITRSGPIDRTVVIDLAELPSGNLLADISGNQLFTSMPGNVTIPAGSYSTSFFVTAVNDTVYTGNRTIQLNASSELYGNAIVGLRIVDDEQAPSGFNAWSNNATRSEKHIFDYAIGGAAFGQLGELPVFLPSSQEIALEAIVRINDPTKLTVQAQSTHDLLNGLWSSENVTMTVSGNQTGVLNGFQRQRFSVPVQGDKRFIRLHIHLKE